MRAKKVKEAWSSALNRIASVHGDDGPSFEQIMQYAPAMATKIDEAEKAAEAASIEWRDNAGPGGVQAKIDAWVTAWLDAIEAVGRAA